MELESGYSNSGNYVELIQVNVGDYIVMVNGKRVARVSDLDSAYASYWYYLAQ